MKKTGLRGRILFALAIVFLAFSCQRKVDVAKQGVPPADQVPNKRAEATVRFLADDLLEGRGTPSRGLDIAALYLGNELRAAGWEPANGESYFQTYAVKSFSPQKSRYKFSINGVELDPKKFLFLPIGMDPARTPVKYNLVFAGYGIFAPEQGVNDYEGVDLKDRASVALLGAPWGLDPLALHAYDKCVGKMVHVRVRNGALLIYATEELEAPAGSPPSLEVGFFREYSQITGSFLPEFEGKSTMGMSSVLIIGPSEFDRTLAKATGGTYAEWKNRLAKEKSKARPVDASIEVKIETEPVEAKAGNVVALLRGSDPTLRDEWLVLTAHYDHLGFYEAPADQDGIYNGADDNASGTAAVLEVARHLASVAPPRRSVLVVFTSGEEMGLLGSAYYSLHPLVPASQVVANINIDMVGRSTSTFYAIAYGSEELYAKAVEMGKQSQVSVLADAHPTWRLTYFIDSYHFARLSVPYIEFFTEMHADYHKPTDEVGLIKFEELNRIIDAASALANYYAQGGPRPTFKRPEWFLTPD